tara:strand:- start:203 stop:1069 length:867 start_codon:yes stop_codon:yes gene_type:complete
MSLFRIENFTRYNTEDLQALLDSVEKAIQARGKVPQRARLHPHKDEEGRIGPTVTVKDYSPSEPYLTVSAYVPRPGGGGGSNQNIRVRAYVKHKTGYLGTSAADIRIIQPNKLFVDPVEALAACDKHSILGDFLPAEATADLVARFLCLFSGTHTGWRGALRESGQEIQRAVMQDEPSVRIGKRRAAKVGVEERHRVAKLKAAEDWSEGRYFFCALLTQAGKVDRAHNRATARLLRAKVPMDETQDRVAEAAATLAQAVEDLKRAIEEVRTKYIVDDEPNPETNPEEK